MDRETYDDLARRSRDWQVQTACRVAIGRGSELLPLAVTALEYRDETAHVALAPTTFAHSAAGARLRFDAPEGGRITLSAPPHLIEGPGVIQSVSFELQREMNRRNIAGAGGVDGEKLALVLWDEFPLPVLGSPTETITTLKDLVSTAGVVGGVGVTAAQGGVETPAMVLLTASTLFVVHVLIPGAQSVVLPSLGVLGQGLADFTARRIGVVRKKAPMKKAPKRIAAKKTTAKKTTSRTAAGTTKAAKSTGARKAPARVAASRKAPTAKKSQVRKKK